jgi:glycosyltransferase involved in cell wall biosynthesis
MPPLRVAYLITDSGVGGTEKMLAALIRGLDRTRFEPSLLALKPLGETARALAAEGIPVTSLGLPARVSLSYLLRLPGAFRKLRRELLRLRPDILHCFLFQANLLGRLAAGFSKVPANLSSLRVIEAVHRFQLPLDRISSGWVTRYTAVGEAVRRFAIEEIGLDPAQVAVIPNGIDPGAFAGLDPNRIRREFRIPPAAPLIGTMGRLHAQKGMDLFLQAVSKLRAGFPELRALVAGEGPDRPGLERLAASLDLSAAVIFTGLRRDGPALLAGLDLFVLASRYEGMPNTILEAMAAGKAVVAAAVGAVPELVQEGQTGLLVPPEDADALARAVRLLLSDAELRRRLGANGRARVETEFSLEKMIRLTEELYLDVRNLRRAI